jgi:hypothetical protein
MDLITLGTHFIRRDLIKTLEEIKECFKKLDVIYTEFSGGYDGTVIHQHHYIEIQLCVFERKNEFIFEISELTRTYSAYDDFLSQFSDYMHAGFPKKRSFSPPPMDGEIPLSVCNDIISRLTDLNGVYECLYYAKKPIARRMFTPEFMSHFESLLQNLTDEEEERACLISILRILPRTPRLMELIREIGQTGSEHAKRQALLASSSAFHDASFTSSSFQCP